MANENGQSEIAVADLLNRTDVVILDTETTGFSRQDQILWVSVIDTTGEVRLDSAVMPTCKIHENAAAVHGYSYGKLAEAKGAGGGRGFAGARKHPRVNRRFVGLQPTV